MHSFSRLLRKLPDGVANEIPVTDLLVGMLRVRMDAAFKSSKIFMRMLKRLIHLVGQAAQLSIESRLVKECPQPNLESKYHPFLEGSRRRGNTALSQALVARFAARGGGYVSCKEELTLGQLGILKDSRSFGGKTASEFCCRMLMKTASFVSGFFAEKKSWCINVCFDAAMVSTEHVLSIIIRLDSRQFSAPTQLLPLGTSRQQAEDALVAFREWLDGSVPTYNESAMQVLQNPSFKWREFRTSTKTLLCGFANGLQQCMPSGWTLQCCVPPNPLKPASITCSRYLLTAAEKKAFGLEETCDCYVIFDHRSHDRSIDFYAHDNFHHLTMSADEGTEVNGY